MPTDVILHLLRLADLRSSDEPITAASLQTEGFVHCSPDEPTMLMVANALYRDEDEPMAVLVLDPARIGAPVRFEAPAGAAPGFENRLFPHVYGVIDRAAIVDIRYARRDATGAYVGFDSDPC